MHPDLGARLHGLGRPGCWCRTTPPQQGYEHNKGEDQERVLLLHDVTMKVWLARKHADRIDGVDLRGYQVGDTLEISSRDACLLLAEKWAEVERRTEETPAHPRRRAHDQD